MSNVVIFKDDTVTFTTTLFKPNELPVTMPMEASVTPWGFFIGLDYGSYNIMDWFEGRVGDKGKAIVIGASGNIYEYVSVDRELVRRRIPQGKDLVYIRADNKSHDDYLTAFLECGLEPMDAVRKLAEITTFNPMGYRTTPMSELLEALKIVKAMEVPPFPANR